MFDVKLAVSLPKCHNCVFLGTFGLQPDYMSSYNNLFIKSVALL